MNPQHANSSFEGMKNAGFFSEDKTAGNYIGNFMFMGYSDDFALFKHTKLSSYVKISTVLLDDLQITNVLNTNPIINETGQLRVTEQDKTIMADLIEAASNAIAFFNMRAQAAVMGLPDHEDNLRQQLCNAVSAARGQIVCGNLTRTHEAQYAIDRIKKMTL